MADARQAMLSDGRACRTPHAGVFLFWPLLAKVGWDELVRQAGYPGSKMVPAPAALLSLLALKLLDKERRSHVSDFNFDQALGWFAGLNVLPKTTFTTDYSYRTTRDCQRRLLEAWVPRLMTELGAADDAFCLDFHAIPYRGDPEALENHYLPCRGKAATSVLTFFAQAQQSRVLCYSDADLVRAQQPDQLLRFVEFCASVFGQDPAWLYFDSRFTTYAELNRLNQRGHTSFITIRRRGARLLQQIQQQPPHAWKRAVIDTPKRRARRIRYLDQTITLRPYEGPVRQLALTGLGRAQPTLLLSNNFTAPARELVIRYAGRNGVEDGLGTSVDFFHLDRLASEVRLNADLDAALTVIANGCYRWLANRLHGFAGAKPKTLFRKFVATAGSVRTFDDRIEVRFDKRSHNPILRQAALDDNAPTIPWLGNRRLTFSYAGANQ